MVQGRITDTPTVQLGATPSELVSDPPPSSPYFYAGFPSCHNPPNLSWLGTGTGCRKHLFCTKSNDIINNVIHVASLPHFWIMLEFSQWHKLIFLLFELVEDIVNAD